MAVLHADRCPTRYSLDGKLLATEKLPPGLSRHDFTIKHLQTDGDLSVINAHPPGLSVADMASSGNTVKLYQEANDQGKKLISTTK
jgi:hypothetical protein